MSTEHMHMRSWGQVDRPECSTDALGAPRVRSVDDGSGYKRAVPLLCSWFY